MQPRTKEELKSIIAGVISKGGRFADLNFLDVSQITDMSHLFEESEFNGDISKWDVSNVTNMERMFRKSRFNGDISNWDVSNVTNMEGLFASTDFTGDISNWNVSKVTNMRSVFFSTPFNGDISRWDVSSVTNMRTMFYQSKFNGDISSWNVSNVENMDKIFEGSLFRGNIFNWNLSKIEDLSAVCKGGWTKNDSQMMLNLLLKKYGKITAIRDKEALKKAIQDKIKSDGNNADLNSLDVSQITDMSHLFEESDFNGDISRWDVSNVTNMERMFRKSRFNGDISKWNVSNVTNMEGLFASSRFAGDISNWDVSKVQNMRSLFYGTSFDGDISWWNVSNVTNMRTMFYDSKFNGNLSRWNVSRVQTMECMFMKSDFMGDISMWNVSSDTDLKDMFKSSRFNLHNPNFSFNKQNQEENSSVKTIKMDASCLEGEYKILSASAIEQIKGIIQNAKEETVVELPQGLLFLNLTEDDFEDIEANDNVVFKVPSTVIGYSASSFMDCGNRILLPSFMQETNIASSFGDEYYDCDVPKRKFAFSGNAHVGQEIQFKLVDDEDEANEFSEKLSDAGGKLFDDFDCDASFAVVDVADDANGPAWTLEIEKLKLDLYTDDYESGIYFDVDDELKMLLITYSSEVPIEQLFESAQAIVQVRNLKRASREGLADEFAGIRMPDPFACEPVKNFWEAGKSYFEHVNAADIKAGYYIPTLLCRMGTSGVGSSVETAWTLAYYGRNLDWNNGGDEEDVSYYFYEDDDYKELPFDD